MYKTTYLVLLAIILVATSCYYDNEEYLYPVTGNLRECDTVTVSYALHVAPIVSAKCLTCHSIAAAPSSGGNIALEGYAKLQQVAASGKLVGAVSHNPGFSAMPKGGNKLSYCEISYMRRWVEAGTPNN